MDWEGILETEGWALADVVAGAGPWSAQVLRAASRTLAGAVALALPKLQRLFPSGLCAFGGGEEASAEYFDIASGTWRPLPSISSARGRSPILAVGSGYGRVYICGFEVTGVTWHGNLDPCSGAWEALPDFVSPRMQGRLQPAAAIAGGMVYVCGGSTRGGHALRSAARFDPASMRGNLAWWEELPPMVDRRCGAAAAGLNGRVYVGGGVRQNHRDAVPLRSVESFESSNNTWKLLAPLSEPRACAAAAVVASNLFFCGGGRPWGARSCDSLRSVERLSLECSAAGGAWEALASMGERRRSAAAGGVSGLLYVCGGFCGAEGLYSAERFDPSSGCWQQLPTMTQRCGVVCSGYWPEVPCVRP